MDTYRMELTIRPEFSAFTVGQLVAEAMAGLPDEPLDYSFDPYWDGSAEVTLPLVYSAPGLDSTEVGSIKIYPENTFVCSVCNVRQFVNERLSHGRTHVVTGGPVEPQEPASANATLYRDEEHSDEGMRVSVISEPSIGRVIVWDGAHKSIVPLAFLAVDKISEA